MLGVAFVQSRGARSIETHPLDPIAFLRTWRGGWLGWEEHQQLPRVSFLPSVLPGVLGALLVLLSLSPVREGTGESA